MFVFHNVAYASSILIWLNIIINWLTLRWAAHDYQHQKWTNYHYASYRELNLHLNHFLIILSLILLLAGTIIKSPIVIHANYFYFSLIFNTIISQYFINIYLWHYSQNIILENLN